MKKLLLLLFLIPNLVMGEWTRFTHNMFFDVSTLEIVNKNKVRLMTYANVPEGETPWGSASMFFEFNCKEKAYRILNRKLFSMPDLQGEMTIDNSNYRQWEYTAKNSNIGTMLNTVCRGLE